MKHPSLSSPMSIYLFALKYLFGMPESGLGKYRADTSGPLAKPNSKSQIRSEDRLDFMIHHGFLRSWTGPYLIPTTQRFANLLDSSIRNTCLSEDWVEIPDFSDFIKQVVGRCFIQTLFGPALLHRHPKFVEDMWKFDDAIPWLAWGIPSWIMPKAHSLRSKLHRQLQDWYTYARQNFTEDGVDSHGDGDPIWGSWLMRYRQDVLSKGGSHDDASLAAADLGLIWAYVQELHFQGQTLED
ncbi:putative NACHT and Ankyrin domain protein [Rosellinia necatrix]|uniref:Putative NACHT and Ankyrin domain protein n=1 Tax=Rosellinia necatrix TaxID=77044 RepID=A0A1S7UNT6_ROSNE|nr:putative NACHT and Ankyrin domain protein [Rosellinia necatrix]